MANNWDVIAVALGMTIGFTIILMNFTGIWPCNIIHALDKSEVLNEFKSTNSISNSVGDIRYWLSYLFQCN